MDSTAMRSTANRSGAATVISPSGFGWDRRLTVTLRHVSLPWDEPLRIAPLTALRQIGARDRLSLIAQFAAHQALLQFAGVADGELDPGEWGVVQKRGSDVRLVRTAARSSDVTVAPPVVAVVQQFASVVGGELPVLRQPSARADAIYAEAYARLMSDVAADLQWVRRAACGAVAAPGPEGLSLIAEENGRFRYCDERALKVVERYAHYDRSIRFVHLEGVSPLERYSGLQALGIDDPTLEPPVVAERILAATSSAHHLFAISREEAFDAASREVVGVLASARHGAWLMPDEGVRLPDSRPFVVAPSIASGSRLRSVAGDALENFVMSPQFGAYLSFGDVPEESEALPTLAEPTRSYVGALALLGSRVRCELASRFLREFLFRGELEDLVIPGVTALEDGALVFASDAIHEQARRLIPQGSRAPICRVAAQHAEGAQAAFLWLDAGEPASAAAVLENIGWADPADLVRALRRVPDSILTPSLRSMYGAALVNSGRYREACALVPGDELLLARAERRMGDYATALKRLERTSEQTFEALLLQAEVLRLVARDDDALGVLERCRPASAEERVRLDYERALHGADISLPEDHYLSARLATYRALERNEFGDAALHARASHDRARTTIERIDASLDRLFAVFSAGAWDEARAIAVEALQEVEETQGDRAAGGILFTLAFLAADAGQWTHASQRIARLRHYYASTGDALRLAELSLLSAHLDFCRGRLTDARRAAQSVFDGRRHHDQIREAAALILDEIDWVQRKSAPLRSTGTSGNEELRRRHLRLSMTVAGFAGTIATGEGVPDKLFAFRRALARDDQQAARKIAEEFDLVIESPPSPGDVELDLLRIAATREFPFAPHDFELSWCFATRNRLGQWHTIGSFAPAADELNGDGHSPDWIVCSEREMLFAEGSAHWAPSARDALAALFRLRAENHRLQRLVEQEESAMPVHRGVIEGIVGQSPAIRQVETLVSRVARRDVPICVLGESGTGKELVARAIHLQSARRQKQFTAVNCAALPENLIESELFGHVRGAFTGADRDRAGLIEATDGGTLFLDEIGELPLTAQAKLLRFLQEGEFRRVGEATNRTADVRLVSATNRKLDAAVEQGRFRDDLYYRIRGVEVLLPPLRERGGDILLLVAHFLRMERERHGAGPALLSADVEAIFTTYSWPGNVRELQNTIRAAHAMAGEAKEIGVEHLPERLRNIAPAKVSAGSYQDSVARFKRELIERSLLEARGNQNRAAAMLKMSRQALAYQIRELGIMVRL
jgi:DNA-binding NtrC family response regulator